MFEGLKVENQVMTGWLILDKQALGTIVGGGDHGNPPPPDPEPESP